MYTHEKQYITGGVPLANAKNALILLHGRGARAEDILSLGKHFNIRETAILAPQATNRSWYPYSFLAPVEENQPALDSALQVISEMVADLNAAGIAPEHIYFAGFSQGACLTLEYTARHAQKYGGIVAFTGGLIGRELDKTLYSGDFSATPVFNSTGDPDPHVPVERVDASAQILSGLNALVTKQIYPGRPHSVLPDEIAWANKVVFA